MAGDFQVEVESIQATVAWMRGGGGVIETATKLKQVMDQLNAYAVQSDWSQVPSCIAFGASYNSAIEAYTAVAGDILKDAGDMADALTRIAEQYTDADESARARFDAAIKNFADAGYMTQSPADDVYQQNRPDLHSDDPEQAPAQSPDAATGNGTTTDRPAPATSGGGRVVIG